MGKVTAPNKNGGVAVGAVSARLIGGEKAQRIVEAMRESVAEVGVANSTFERVAAKAGVSRGLVHYYFGTKERLLVEVVRRDTEYRIQTLGTALREADTDEEVISAFFETFAHTVSEEQGYVYLVSELFVAGRHSPEISRELGGLYSRARSAFAEILREKERKGIIRLRFNAEAVLSYLFSAGDGGTIQQLTDPTLDIPDTTDAAYGVAHFLISSPAPAKA
jgi:AcrR family transcriptional regulator